MAKKIINVGVSANDSTGDSLRVAGVKINDNFTELYNLLGGETGAPLSIVSRILPGNGIVVSAPTGDVLITNKIATEGELGGIRIGPGINITEDGIASVQVYELPKASQTILGGIKVGDRLSIDANGVLSADPGAYSLPKASGSVLGGVKVGAGLSIDPGGILSVTIPEYSLPTASPSILGGVKVGARLSINDGVLSADPQGAGTSIENSGHVLSVELTGKISLPTQGIKLKDVFVTAPTGVGTVLYSTENEYVRAVKIVIFAEKLANGYESQACEIIGTIDQSSNIIYSSVYGVVYTGAQQLFTISSDYDLPTTSYQIFITPSGADTISVRALITEIYGTD